MAACQTLERGDLETPVNLVDKALRWVQCSRNEAGERWVKCKVGIRTTNPDDEGDGTLFQNDVESYGSTNGRHTSASGRRQRT